MLGQGCFVGHARGFELSRSISIAEVRVVPMCSVAPLSDVTLPCSLQLLGAPGVMEKGLTAEAIHLRMQNLTSDSVPSANLVRRSEVLI